MASRGRSVQYVAKRDEVAVGLKVTSDGQHCALLHRPGGFKKPFMLSKYQRRALNRGKAINVTSAAIELAERYGCHLHVMHLAGGLRGARRRRRRQ